MTKRICEYPEGFKGCIVCHHKHPHTYDAQCSQRCMDGSKRIARGCIDFLNPAEEADKVLNE